MISQPSHRNIKKDQKKEVIEEQYEVIDEEDYNEVLETTLKVEEINEEPHEDLIDENVSWYGYDDFLKEQAEKRKQHIAKNVSLKSYGNTF